MGSNLSKNTHLGMSHRVVPKSVSAHGLLWVVVWISSKECSIHSNDKLLRKEYCIKYVYMVHGNFQNRNPTWKRYLIHLQWVFSSYLSTCLYNTKCYIKEAVRHERSLRGLPSMIWEPQEKLKMDLFILREYVLKVIFSWRRPFKIQFRQKALLQ